MASKKPPVFPNVGEPTPLDFVSTRRAQDEWKMERATELENVKIFKNRVRECVIREEVNHPQRCREHVLAYFQALKKYKSEGWFKYH